MKSHDERADNLLSRLFSYTPREGRQPLENFCTEMLAWCLRQSPAFLARFLKQTEIPDLQDWQGSAQIHTQLTYSGEATLEDEGEKSEGRFDLVIESTGAKAFVLVVESKVGAGFRQNQLEDYKHHLETSDAFSKEASRYLVTLTTIRHMSSQTNGTNLTWPDVFRLLVQCPHPDDPFVAGSFLQFAAFLKEKGLSMLELKKTDDGTLAQWFAVKKLEEQLNSVVERLRNQTDMKPIVGRRQVKQQGDDWVGVSGDNSFWAGFGISKKGKPELFMWVEITVPGGRHELCGKFDSEMNAAFNTATARLKDYDDTGAINCGNLAGGNSRFVFAKSVIGELDGNGEDVFGWLYDISRKAISLAGKEKKRNV